MVGVGIGNIFYLLFLVIYDVLYQQKICLECVLLVFVVVLQVGIFCFLVFVVIVLMVVLFVLQGVDFGGFLLIMWLVLIVGFFFVVFVMMCYGKDFEDDFEYQW